jgi:hypothetical protein
MSVERPNLIKHLEFIQITIVRMAANSFVIKGWTVTLVTVILAFATNDANPNAASIALIPAIMFWSLDAYYLRTEREFRALYDHVRQNLPEDDLDVDFSLDVTKATARTAGTLRVAFTRTLAPFYLALIAVIIAVWLLAPKLIGGNS